MEGLAIEFVKSFGGKRHILKLYKTHGPVLLRPEAEPLVSSLLGKHGLQFLLGRVDGQITHIQSIARWVLIRRIYGGEVVSRVAVAVDRISMSGRWSIGWRQRAHVRWQRCGTLGVIRAEGQPCHASDGNLGSSSSALRIGPILSIGNRIFEEVTGFVIFTKVTAD
jgi:hypothetical protein